MLAVLIAFLGVFTVCFRSDLGVNIGLWIPISIGWALLVWLLPKPKIDKVGLVLGIAIVLRLLIATTEPFLSDDIFRYVWEGNVSRLGENPYLHAPSQYAVSEDGIHPFINHPHLTSIYPPLSMCGFAALSAISYSIWPFKLATALADALIVWVIADILQHRKQSLSGAWLYALHPLPILEAAGSGHLESWGILFLMLAIRAHVKGQSAFFFLGIGGLIKILPFLLLPAVRKVSWRQVVIFLLLAVVTWLPFSDAGMAIFSSFMVYGKTWAFNGAVFPVVQLLFSTYARIMCIGIGGLICLYALWKKPLFEQKAMWICGAFVLLSPTIHPWYTLWVWAPALLCRVWGWTLLASVVPLSYVALLSYDPSTHVWEPPIWPQFVQFPVVIILLLGQWLWHWIRPGPYGGGPQKTTLASQSQITPDL